MFASAYRFDEVMDGVELYSAQEMRANSGSEDGPVTRSTASSQFVVQFLAKAQFQRDPKQVGREQSIAFFAKDLNSC